MGHPAHVLRGAEVDDAHVQTKPKAAVHRIGDDLSGSWLDTWVVQGLEALQAYLAKHAAFQRFLEAQA